jgi:predicted enzyme related to lactoylglutathione lyase
MHRSRLAGFIIDSPTDDLDGAAEFWSRALGYATKPSDNPEDSNYVLFDTGPDGIHIEVQRVTHPSRVHLDIETDDIEAEVERLEKLGARRIEQVRTWWVMEAPSGHRFCVVRSGGGSFDKEANRWE